MKPFEEQHLTGDLKHEDATTAADILESLRTEFKERYKDPSKVPPEKVKFALGQLGKLSELYGANQILEWEDLKCREIEKNPDWQYETPDKSNILKSHTTENVIAMMTVSRRYIEINREDGSLIDSGVVPLPSGIADVIFIDGENQDQFGVKFADKKGAVYTEYETIGSETLAGDCRRKEFRPSCHDVPNFNCFCENDKNCFGTKDGKVLKKTKKGLRDVGSIGNLPVEKLISNNNNLWVISGNKVFLKEQGQDFSEFATLPNQIVFVKIGNNPNARHFGRPIVVCDNGEKVFWLKDEDKDKFVKNNINIPTDVKITAAYEIIGQTILGTNDGTLIFYNPGIKKMTILRTNDGEIRSLEVDALNAPGISKFEMRTVSKLGKYKLYTFKPEDIISIFGS